MEKERGSGMSEQEKNKKRTQKNTKAEKNSEHP